MFAGLGGAGPVLFEFLDTVRVAQRVERVLAGAGRGRNVADHDGLAVADEGVAQHHGELAPAEGRVQVDMLQGADALLKRE